MNYARLTARGKLDARGTTHKPVLASWPAVGLSNFQLPLLRMALSRMASHLWRDAARQDSSASPPPQSGGSEALEDHNQWLRMLTADYNERVSRASTDGTRRSGGDSESDGGFSGRWGEVYDPHRGMDDDAVVYRSMDEAIEQGGELDEEYSEGPIYRGLSLDQAVGEESSRPTDFGDDDADTVDRVWLSANPPLIRRQKAFAANVC